MKKILLLASFLFLGCTAVMAAETPDFIQFQKIIDDKCSKCHVRARVDQAMAEHRDLLKIQERMLKHGAELNSQEQQVLGIFFRALKEKKVSEPVHSEDPLAEYRSVVEARCTGCHAIDIVEKAMLERRKFGTLAQMMIKRGAVLNDRDVKIIQTFWGEPLR